MAALPKPISRAEPKEMLEVREIKTGDPVDAMSVAGEDLTQVSAFGITAELFLRDDIAYCPMVSSRSPGSGKLDEFVALVKAHIAPRELVFVNVINWRLQAHLDRIGVRHMTPEEAFPDDGTW